MNLTEFGAWQSAVTLHDAADICLLAIADFCGVPRKPYRYLHEFPKILETATGKPFLDRTLIEADLSEVRNPAKHRGGFPGVSDVAALVDRTHSCLDENCATYLDRPLSGISLADMIEESDVRALVKEAEGHLSQNQFTEAIGALEHAWNVLLPRFAARLPDSELPERIFSNPMRLTPGAPDPDVRRFAEVLRWWEKVYPKLQLLMLGVDPVRYAAFKGLVPGVRIMGGGQREYYRDSEDVIVHTAEAVDFCLTFVLDTIVRLQDVERIRQRQDRYVIRIKSLCPYYDAEAITADPVGNLPEGHQVDGAHLGLTLWPEDEGRAWFWEEIEPRRTYVIPFASAVIERCIPRSDHERHASERRHEHRARQRDQGDGIS